MSVLIYSKDDCPWCDKAKALLTKNNYSYQELILNKDFTREDLKRIIGEDKKLTVPQILVDNKLVGGYESLLEYFEDHFVLGTQQ